MRAWLMSLIRQAVRAEVEHHFRALEEKTALIESNFANIAVRVKEKQEEAKKHEGQKTPRPFIGEQWGAMKKRLESQSESNG